MKTIKIEVTEEDIRKGVRDNCRECPIASACNRAGLKYPSVYPEEIQYWQNIGLKGWRTSAEVEYWIADYDAGKPVTPFSFEMEIEDGVPSE